MSESTWWLMYLVAVPLLAAALLLAPAHLWARRREAQPGWILLVPASAVVAWLALSTDGSRALADPFALLFFAIALAWAAFFLVYRNRKRR
jgi:hypothetical protein